MRLRDTFMLLWAIYILPFATCPLSSKTCLFDILWNYIPVKYYIYSMIITFPITGVITWTYRNETKQQEMNNNEET